MKQPNFTEEQRQEEFKEHGSFYAGHLHEDGSVTRITTDPLTKSEADFLVHMFGRLGTIAVQEGTTFTSLHVATERYLAQSGWERFEEEIGDAESMWLHPKISPYVYWTFRVALVINGIMKIRGDKPPPTLQQITDVLGFTDGVMREDDGD